MTSWCDKLTSVPTVGIAFDWQFMPSSELLSAIAPILNSTFQGNPPFHITKQDAASFTLSTQSGYSIAIEPGKLAIAFTHNLQAKAVSGGLPTVEYLSVALPFSRILEYEIDLLIKICEKLPGFGRRTLHRIGIMSTTVVDLQDAPPGIRDYIEYAVLPWGSIELPFNLAFSGFIRKDKAWRERCLHTFIQQDGEDDLLSITVDWQRLFTEQKRLGDTPLRPQLVGCVAAAMQYHEELAEGQRLVALRVRECGEAIG